MIKESDSDINVLSITSMIDRVTPYRFRVKTYSRIFQALRIETNKELEHLENFLRDFTDLLNPGGRLVVISYHSIEDRIVKHKMKDLKKEKSIELIFKKPLIPSEKEVQINKRSRSAKMRVGEKIG
jgi:16S rRNA (cytosine1402-N4)-methyltransferase